MKKNFLFLSLVLSPVALYAGGDRCIINQLDELGVSSSLTAEEIESLTRDVEAGILPQGLVEELQLQEQELQQYNEQEFQWPQGQEESSQLYVDLVDVTKCPECGEGGFSYDKDLEKHVKDAHSVMFPCPASGCRRKFVGIRNLKTHVVDVHKDKYRSLIRKINHLKCPKCDTKFDNSEHLKRHIDINHVVKFPCPVDGCDSAYKNIRDLKKHVRGTHDGQAVCPLCEFRFSRRDYMIKHLKGKHLGEAICHICGLDLATNGCLRKHIAREHPEYGPDRPKRHRARRRTQSPY